MVMQHLDDHPVHGHDSFTFTCLVFPTKATSDVYTCYFILQEAVIFVFCVVAPSGRYLSRCPLIELHVPPLE